MRKFWSKRVSELAQLTPPDFVDEEKERHRIYCYVLMALLADYWTAKRSSMSSRPGASPLYLGHNIAALAVDDVGAILGFDFNHNEIFNSSVEHAEARLLRRLFSRPDILFPDAFSTLQRGSQSGFIAETIDAVKDGIENVAARVHGRRSHYGLALNKITIYTSLESCAQCSGMMALGGVKQVFYLQSDSGQNAIGNILYNLSPGSSYHAPEPVPACAIDVPQFDALSLAYSSFSLASTPSTKSGSAGTRRTPPSITSFLCTDDARDIFEGARQRLRRERLKYPTFAPNTSARPCLTNAQVLDHAKRFWEVARSHGRRGTPHPR
jgi:tRNA(Arg) A34 adenosine deaminase TadA